MRRHFLLVPIVLLGALPCGRADESSICCKKRCLVPPPPPCPRCTCSCDHRLILCSLFPPSHARQLIKELDCADSCKRIAAVEKLGCRLHADYCLDPAVLDALLHALQCDPCWGVRRHAAWSLMRQNARTDSSVLALYISARLDPHYMVRVRAAEALDILTLGKEACYTELYKAADQLMRVLQAKGYQPGRDCCLITSATACAPGGGLSIATTLPSTPDKAAAPSAEENVPVEKLPPRKK